MKTLWLTIEDAFVANGRGVLLEPRFVPERAPRGTVEVTLKLPSGEEQIVSGTLDIAHSRGALPPYAMVRLFGIPLEEIVKGTEVWFEDGA